MKRLLVIIISLTICSVAADAFDFDRFHKRFEFGVEWGYTSNLYRFYHYNYNDDIGTRINSSGPDWTYKSNGFLEFLAGVKVGRKLSLDLGSGWSGVYENRNGIPLIFRTSFYTSGFDRDGCKLFAEIMDMTYPRFRNQGSYAGRIGIGRHMVLDKWLGMDISVSAQMVKDHPVDVFDHSRNYQIPNENLRRSDCNYGGVCFSVSLSF